MTFRRGPSYAPRSLLGDAIGIVTLLIGVVLLLHRRSPAPREIGLVMMIMAGFGVHANDHLRVPGDSVRAASRPLPVRAGVALMPVKFALLVLFVWMGLGAVGAAIATTVADVVALAVFAVALYGPKKAARRMTKVCLPAVEGSDPRTRRRRRDVRG